MIDMLRWAGAGVVSLGLVGLALASALGPDEPPPRPRPGLTAQQTKEAVKLAQGAMVELRKKTEGASAPGADLREYVVGVELLSSDQSTPKPATDATAPADGEASNTKPQEKEKEAAESDETQDRLGAAGDRDVLSLFR